MTFLKKLTFFVLLAIFVRAFISLVERPDGSAINQALHASEKMARLASYINQNRSRIETLDFELYKNGFIYQNSIPLESFFPDIKFVGIPENERLEKFPDVDYYLYSEKNKLGMLCNGRVFYGEYNREKIDTIHMNQDVTLKYRNVK
jgi:hypothetical protein